MTLHWSDPTYLWARTFVVPLLVAFTLFARRRLGNKGSLTILAVRLLWTSLGVVALCDPIVRTETTRTWQRHVTILRDVSRSLAGDAAHVDQLTAQLDRLIPAELIDGRLIFAATATDRAMSPDPSSTDIPSMSSRPTNGPKKRLDMPPW